MRYYLLENSNFLKIIRRINLITYLNSFESNEIKDILQKTYMTFNQNPNRYHIYSYLQTSSWTLAQNVKKAIRLTNGNKEKALLISTLKTLFNFKSKRDRFKIYGINLNKLQVISLLIDIILNFENTRSIKLHCIDTFQKNVVLFDNIKNNEDNDMSDIILEIISNLLVITPLVIDDNDISVSYIVFVLFLLIFTNMTNVINPILKSLDK